MELGTRKLLYNLTHRGPLNACERQTATDSELSGGSFCRMIQKKKKAAVSYVFLLLPGTLCLVRNDLKTQGCSAITKANLRELQATPKKRQAKGKRLHFKISH